MNIQQLTKLDRRDLTEMLKNSYDNLNEANQVVYNENQNIFAIEGLIRAKKIDMNDPENVLNAKIQWRLREGGKEIRDIGTRMQHKDRVYKEKSLELLQKNYTLVEAGRILETPNHAEDLARIDYIKNELVILAGYVEFIKFNLPDMSLLKDTFLEAWTIETTDSFPPFKCDFGQPFGYPSAKQLCCEHLLQKK